MRALSDPERFAGAERLLAAAAPQLQRILAQALNEGGWFGDAHESQVRSGRHEPRTYTSAPPDPDAARRGDADGHAASGWRSAGSSPASCRATRTDPEGTDAMDIRFLGQICFELSDGDTRVLIDPFLTGNPKAAVEARATSTRRTSCSPTATPTTTATSSTIAKRTGAPLRRDRRDRERARRPRRRERRPTRTSAAPSTSAGGLWVRARARLAHLDDARAARSRVPAGLVIGLGGKVVYHLGDTCLFSDLRLPGERDEIDVALMCIGGHYTMDRHDAVIAAELVGRAHGDPCHYDTFPPIETDAEAFKADVEKRTGGGEGTRDRRRDPAARRDLLALVRGRPRPHVGPRPARRCCSSPAAAATTRTRRTTGAQTTPTETQATEAVETETEIETETAPSRRRRRRPAPRPPAPRRRTSPAAPATRSPRARRRCSRARAGRSRPRVIRVPPFIAIRVELRSADGAGLLARLRQRQGADDEPADRVGLDAVRRACEPDES